MPEEKKHLADPDVLRSAALLAVIAQHILGAYARRSGLGPRTMAAISVCFEAVRFAVPLFVFLFGMMLSLRSERSFSYPGYLKKRAGQLIVPYLIWTAIYQCDTRISPSASFPGFRALAKAALLGSGAYHLWYVPMILQFVALAFAFVPLFKKLRSMRHPAAGWGLFCAAGLAFLLWLQLFSNRSGLIWSRQSSLCISWLFYFAAGAACGSSYDRFCKIVKRYFLFFAAVTCGGLALIICRDLAAIQSSGAVQFNTVSLQQPLCAMYILCFIFCLQRIAMALSGSALLRRSSSFLGCHSYRAYLCHVAFINVINRQLVQRIPCLPLYYTVLFLSAFAASVLLAWLLDTVSLKAKRLTAS